MGDELQLLSDGDGIAVIGDPGAVELFLTSTGLPSRDLGLGRLSAVSSATSIAAQTAPLPLPARAAGCS